MDGAAKKVNLVAQRILPDRPHHLSISPSERYRVPNDFWQHRSRLQYSTFLSDADRGVLYTRPYYDIREEPETAAANSAHATPRTDPKKPVTKMSFKDYKNQKKIPLSPSENGISGRTDMKTSQLLGTKAGKDGIRRDDGKSRDSDKNLDARSQESRKHEDSDRARNHISKNDSKSTASPLGENKKRATDAEDSPRPQKRPKPENANLPPKPDFSKDGKLGVPSQSTPNGRISASALKESFRGSSPKPTVNGVKSSHLSGSNTSTPRKSDSSSKHFVPPLLSPLRLALDDEHEPKSPKRKAADATTSGKSQARMQKPEGAPPKKQKSPVKIPPLLSPTLPPIVEEALARRQLTPSKGDSSQVSSQENSPGSAKKPRPQAERPVEKEDVSPPTRIVVLKYRKKLAKRVERLLALQPASQKEKLKKERSMSVEPAAPPAKKRPLAAEVATESSASKRVRTSDTAAYSKPLAPSTPSKSAIAMSRAASGTSQAQTPGDSTRLTPSAADRPSTSHDGSDLLSGSKAATLRQRHAEFSRLGTKLKHDRDDIVRGRREGAKIDANGQVQLTAADEKRVVALTLEMVLAYMVAFKSLSQARQTERKPWDPVPWEQLQPHLQELKHRSRPVRALQSLTLQLNAVCLEELCLAYANQEQALGSKAASSFIQASRRRYDAWQAAHDILPAVKDESLRVEMGPWTSPHEAASAALRTLRRWVERESVEWRAEIVLPVANGT